MFYIYFLNFNCRLITLQYCSGFCHIFTWISHGCTCVPHPEPLSHLPPHPIPQGHPSAPALSTLSNAWYRRCFKIETFFCLLDWNGFRECVHWRGWEMVGASMVQTRNTHGRVQTVYLPKREITRINYKRLIDSLSKNLYLYLSRHFPIIIHKMWSSLTTFTYGESDSISSFIMCMCVHKHVFTCVLQNYKACKYMKWCDLRRYMQMFSSLSDGTWGCYSLFVKTSFLESCWLYSSTYTCSRKQTISISTQGQASFKEA